MKKYFIIAILLCAVTLPRSTFAEGCDISYASYNIISSNLSRNGSGFTLKQELKVTGDSGCSYSIGNPDTGMSYEFNVGKIDDYTLTTNIGTDGDISGGRGNYSLGSKRDKCEGGSGSAGGHCDTYTPKGSFYITTNFTPKKPLVAGNYRVTSSFLYNSGGYNTETFSYGYKTTQRVSNVVNVKQDSLVTTNPTTPTLSITSPKTPTTWKKGSSKSVSWSGKNLPAGAVITGYLVNGYAHTQLFTNGTGNKNSFIVPSTLSEGSGTLPNGSYIIRLTATNQDGTVITTANGTTITVSSPPAKAYNPIGYFDAVNCSVISGWTCDQNDFNTPLRVDVYSGAPAGRGNHVINDTANVKREAGVGARCGGNPAHGFNVPTPSILKDNKTHDIYVYGINIGPGANKLLGHKKMGKCSK